MLKLTLNLLLILLITALQLSLLPTLGLLTHLNLILCLIVFICLTNYHRSLWWTLIAGLFLDLYSPLPFGSLTLILLLTTILTNFLFKKFFTHRTLPALFSLGLIATLFYQITLFTLSWLFYLIKFLPGPWPGFTKIYFITSFWQIILNLIFLLVLGLIDRVWKSKTNQ